LTSCLDPIATSAFRPRESSAVDQNEPLIRNISDTALWVAAYRARESARPDALFNDPFARRLAGERGEQIANSMPYQGKNAWPFAARTYLFDQFIAAQIRAGVDTVINLAAGLDTRPYRMPLPVSLKWIEVDLPEILAYKEEILSLDTPACSRECIRVDLSDAGARRDLFADLGRRVESALVVTEGLLVYLSPEDAGSLARDLSAQPSFKFWLNDIASPGLLAMMQKQMSSHLNASGAAMNFGPEAGPDFFLPFGWKPVEVRSLLKTAAQLRRLPFFLRLAALLPESSGKQGSRPWSAVCLFARQ
jgi:methyltransferase (TIGR00027 family)